MVTKAATIDEFMTKASELTHGTTDQRALLAAFADWLQGRGQFVDGTSLQDQFIEQVTVLDKKKIPIVKSHCMVCGHDTFEVQAPG